MTAPILNLGEDAQVDKAFALEDPAIVPRSVDPVILPQPYVQPGDFTAQYPQPLDPTELLEMCEEVTLLQAIPTESTSLNAHLWREMDTLEFVSGSSYLAFADGECPEGFQTSGDNSSVDIKNIGAKKTLSLRDIRHSTAVAAANWHGINTIVGGFPAGEGVPGGSDFASFQTEHIANIKEKAIRTGMTLVMNGWDKLLVDGDHVGNSLEFTGIENWATNYSCSFHTNDNDSSGTFSAQAFDRYLAEACAKPTLIAGSPQAIQEMLMGYFQLGYQGSQIVNFATGDRITPGYNFAGFVNTGKGKMVVVADDNFRRNDIGGGNFQADLWALRMTHNGEPLVYQISQFPLSLNDLTPGCTAISFQIWAATALVIKICCAQNKFTTQFTGRLASTCSTIG